jgi:hypothetical protein
MCTIKYTNENVINVTINLLSGIPAFTINFPVSPLSPLKTDEPFRKWGI